MKMLDGVLENFTGQVNGLDQSALENLVQEWMNWLKVGMGDHQVVGLLADNSEHWIALDLALGLLGHTLVPLPSFFTDDQLKYLLGKSKVSKIVTDDPFRANGLGFLASSSGAKNSGLFIFESPSEQSGSGLNGVSKVTFTSGTTGQPKGVCLDLQTQLETAQALTKATSSLQIKRHLCLLPLSVLLENIAGVYAPLMAGADLIVPALAEVGLKGAADFDPYACLEAIDRYQPESIIVLPQMLLAMMRCLSMNDSRIKSLKFVAVGGAKVPVSLLEMSRVLGLPVYEGYGLSEACSVICLNTPENSRLGSVGRPLEGVQVTLSADNEVWVKGRSFLGYLNDQGEVDSVKLNSERGLATGDLGAVDQHGFVTLSGRKKNLIITSLGRNVSPEWPEGLLLATGLLRQAVVFGEGQASLSGVVVPMPSVSLEQVAHAVSQVNKELPDYARIDHLVYALEPFSFENGLATANGRVRREEIAIAYAKELQQANIQSV